MKIGTIVPLEPRTFPNLTTTNFVADPSPRAWRNRSATSFEAPITPVGLTALSVERATNVFTPCASARSASPAVARMLFSIASTGCPWSIGTCL